MLNTNFSIFSLVLMVSLCQAQSNADKIMDFEKYDPPSTLVVPEHMLTKAKMPFIDVHSHHFRG